MSEAEHQTRSELDDLVEHLERYRAITLQVFDLVSEEELEWRPAPDQYSLGQQLLHIAQAEDRFAHGLFADDWSFERVRFPPELPSVAEMKRYFEEVRSFTLERLEGLDPSELGAVLQLPDAPVEHTLRSWLWFVLEHELHHRGQVWAYLRAMGHTPPFYAMPLPLGERPDHQAREELGGFRVESSESSATAGQPPRVGVGCIVVRSGRVLLVRTRSGFWSTPGGHLDFDETPAECAARETEEETGVRVVDVELVAITNDVFRDRGAHYVTIWMRGEALDGDVVIGDTGEIAEAGWFDPASLPSPRHLYFENLLAGRCVPPEPRNLPAFETE